MAQPILYQRVGRLIEKQSSASWPDAEEGKLGWIMLLFFYSFLPCFVLAWHAGDFIELNEPKQPFINLFVNKRPFLRAAGHSFCILTHTAPNSQLNGKKRKNTSSQ